MATSPLLFFPPGSEPLHSIMLLTRGTQKNGEPFWAYMYIRSSMAKSFKEAQGREDFSLEEYGTVLEWGEGTDPTPEIRARMERDFGMRHDYEDMLLKAIAMFG